MILTITNFMLHKKVAGGTGKTVTIIDLKTNDKKKYKCW